MRRLLDEALLFLLAVVRPTAKSVRDNVGLAALSIVLAFGLWIFVTDTENPTRKGLLPLELTLEPVNVAADVALASELSTVRVRVAVADDVWDNLTAADFEATVDLDGRQAGTHNLPVEVRALTGRGGLRVIGVVPVETEVKLEPLFSKSVEVVVEVGGEPPSGFSLKSVEAEDKTALVTGPQARVELVSQVVASLDVSARTGSVRQAVRLEPRDQRGFLAQGVAVNPAVTKVVADIEQTAFSRTLVVSPQIEGVPKSGYNVVGLTVSPPTLTIFGAQSLIQETTSVRTQPVDIGDAESDVVRSVSLELPAGASVSGGVSVTVTVEIEAGAGQLAFGVPVSATGLGPGLSVVGGVPSAQVVLSGPLPALLELQPSDIAASVDLSGLEAGGHSVRVKVTAPAGLEVASVSPEEVEVLLETR